MEAAIIEEFFKKGKLLTPEALGLLENGYEYRYTKELIVKQDSLEKTKITNMVEVGEYVTTNDIIAQINKKYEKMKAIISSRLSKNFVSINNLQKGDVFLIGVVKEINGNKIELEDPTGVLIINIESRVELDDVIAISGFFDGFQVIKAVVLFPDVPIRTPKKTQGKICIATGLDFKDAPETYTEKFFDWFSQSEAKTLIAIGKLDETAVKIYERTCKDKKMIFIRQEYPNKGNETGNANILIPSNPCTIDINGIKILAASDFTLDNLRKRQFKHPKIPCQPLVIEEVPDIVVYNTPYEPQITNYKSITFVNTGSILANFKPVIIDLSTREAEQKTLVF